jgi:polar amino acid transport system substrate-binding protein
MKLTVRRMLILAFLVPLFWSCAKKEEAGDRSLEKVTEQGFFVLGLDDSFPPMGFRNEAGDIDGFDIDLAREVADRLGVELQLRPVDWDGVILSLNKGDIDMVWNGMTITESRKEKINFSKPYLANRQIIVVREDGDVTSKADLAGKVVGIQLGSSSEEAVSGEPEVLAGFRELKKYSNNIEALMDLAAGRSSAVVLDEIVGRYYIAKRPGIYTVLSDNFGSEEYGIGFRKADNAFREAVDKALDDMRADGAAAEISKKWFGEAVVLD